MSDRVHDAYALGFSVWHDDLSRALLTSGALAQMVREGVVGVTSNPSIFEKAIDGSSDYDAQLTQLVLEGTTDPKAIYERLAIDDIRTATDVLRPAYERTGGRDGFVSMEVSPLLAHDAAGTVAEARRLVAAIGRDNALVKVPGTAAGMVAIEELTALGISVNVTLLFSIDAYRACAAAFIVGLERFAAAGGDLGTVTGIASFFLSRIDTLVDQRIGIALQANRDRERGEQLESLRGAIAIASAKVAYREYQTIVASPRWQSLAGQGARPQRLLWASTSTKNPDYPPTMYVDGLIGPDIVNTMTAATYREFRDHSTPRVTVTEDLAGAERTLALLEAVGISLAEVTATLLAQGVAAFSASFEKLLAAIERKRKDVVVPTSAATLAHSANAIAAALEEWRVSGKVERLWTRDASLWTGQDEGQWLGWLDLAHGQQERVAPLIRFADQVRAERFAHVVVLGMGGSSLFPWALARTFGRIAGSPALHVLDSIVPAQIRSVERAIDLASTLFVVSSKSGTTTEVATLCAYFMNRVQRARIENPGGRFVAITDPGTALETLALRERFRDVWAGWPTVGGRYSALSNFGMVPAVLMGLDIGTFRDRAEGMVRACGASVPPAENPGVRLGVMLGTLARSGRDKLTIIASPSLRALGAWIEQLVAESTGKDGRGVVPVDDEDAGPVGVYGDDRVFVYVRASDGVDAVQDAAITALERASHPVIRIAVKDVLDLGQEVFRWEVATAVACSILGVNAFDQPDVEASKRATAALLEHGDGAVAPRAPQQLGGVASHLSQLGRGDYFAIGAYLEMNDDHRHALQAIRHLVRDRRRVATTLGFGPRFLHSTGQLHKGGPASGVFLQITADHEPDLPIPDRSYTFGALARAQADGDLQVLAERNRRSLRVHLGSDVSAGLEALRELVDEATRS